MQERRARLKTQLIVLAVTLGAVAFVWWAGPTRLWANPLNWGTEVDLSQTTDTTETFPGIAAQGQTVYAVWPVTTTVDYDPYYARSDNGGGTWTLPDCISSSINTASSNVAVAIDGAGNPHFVWTEQEEADFDIYYRYDMNSSEMIKDTDPWHSFQPDIVITNSTVHVVWADTLSAILYVSKTVAANWNDPATENVRAGLNAYFVPDMAVGGDGKVHVVWTEDQTTGPTPLQFVHYNRRNGSWGIPKNLISPTRAITGVFDYPAIAISGTNSIYVIYSNATVTATQYIEFMKSADGGDNWSAATTITGPLSVNTASPQHLVPDITADGAGIRAVWSGIPAGATNQNEIVYYGHSTDEGATWTIEQVTAGNYNRTTAAMDVVQDDVHLVYARGSHAAWDVYYVGTGQGGGGGVYLPVILKNYQ